MRRNPEKWAWNNVVRGFLKGVPSLAFDRIESSVGLGIPDIAYSTTKAHGWIELKVGHVKGDNLTLPTLTRQQKNWIRKRAIMCGGVWVWVYIPDHETHFIVGGRYINLIERCPIDTIHNMASWAWMKGRDKKLYGRLLSNLL